MGGRYHQRGLNEQLHIAVIYWDSKKNSGTRQAYRGGADTNNMHYNAITGSYDSNLHLAVRHSPKAIKVLLRLGINTGLLNSNNETAADVARKIGREKDARRIERWNGSLRQRLVHISIRYTGVPPGKPGLKSFISVQSKIHP